MTNDPRSSLVIQMVSVSRTDDSSMPSPGGSTLELGSILDCPYSAPANPWRNANNAHRPVSHGLALQSPSAAESTLSAIKVSSSATAGFPYIMHLATATRRPQSSLTAPRNPPRFPGLKREYPRGERPSIESPYRPREPPHQRTDTLLGRPLGHMSAEAVALVAAAEQQQLTGERCLQKAKRAEATARQRRERGAVPLALEARW